MKRIIFALALAFEYDRLTWHLDPGALCASGTKRSTRRISAISIKCLTLTVTADNLSVQRIHEFPDIPTQQTTGPCAMHKVDRGSP